MPSYSAYQFATLTPENVVAQKCLALILDRNPNLLPSVAGTPPTPPTTLTTQTTQINLEPPKSTDRAARSKYQLLLSIDQHGHASNGSWVVGKGSTKYGVPNLQLCSPRSRHLKGPFLGKITINPHSGAFILQNISEHHSIVYLQANGDTDIELRFQDKHVLHMTSNHLRFGPLDYVLEFRVESEVGFSNARAGFMQRYIRDSPGHAEPPCHHLDLLPKPTHVRVGDVVLHKTVSKGAFGVVRVGVHRRSGDVVAVKTIHCQRRDVESVKNEIIIASGIPASTAGVVSLLYSWCEHGHNPPCFGTGLEDVHLSMPYAPYDFTTAPWPDTPLITRLAIFRQVLEGLQNLHSLGIMHRDISPKNLLIFSLRDSAPSAAICDFGKSKKGAKGTGTSLGPTPFVAPEVWGRQGYTNAIDVFSLGLTMLATFQPWLGSGPIDESSYEEVLRHLASLQEQGRIAEDLAALLRLMLAWNPADRPTAEEALDDGVWEQIRAASSNSQIQSTDESPESGTGLESGSVREKRLRRSGGLSPESSFSGRKG